MSQREESEQHLVRASVLLLSDDAQFARSVATRWQLERHVPEITIATSDVWQPKSEIHYDLAIVGAIAHRRLRILDSLGTLPAQPAVYVAQGEENSANLRSEFPHLLVVSQHDGWISTLMLVANEALRRVDALGRAHRAERLAIDSLNHATLGRYMLEMRPNINNALTSVIGNADLLLLEPKSRAGDSRDQIQTIHTMALRLNEIMQRFSSLDFEMRAGEKASHAETVSHLNRGVSKT